MLEISYTYALQGRGSGFSSSSVASSFGRPMPYASQGLKYDLYPATRPPYCSASFSVAELSVEFAVEFDVEFDELCSSSTDSESTRSSSTTAAMVMYSYSREISTAI
jgi:hypothetical protein